MGIDALGILTRMGRAPGSVVLPEYLSGLQNFSPTRRSAISAKAAGSRRFFSRKQSTERIVEEDCRHARQRERPKAPQDGVQGAKPLMGGKKAGNDCFCSVYKANYRFVRRFFRCRPSPVKNRRKIGCCPNRSRHFWL